MNVYVRWLQRPRNSSGRKPSRKQVSIACCDGRRTQQFCSSPECRQWQTQCPAKRPKRACNEPWPCRAAWSTCRFPDRTALLSSWLRSAVRPSPQAYHSALLLQSTLVQHCCCLPSPTDPAPVRRLPLPLRFGLRSLALRCSFCLCCSPGKCINTKILLSCFDAEFTHSWKSIFLVFVCLSV